MGTQQGERPPHARPDESGPLDGSLPGEPPTFESLELLVDDQLEKLIAVAPEPALFAEPEVLGGCSCGARFYTIEAAEDHLCRLPDPRHEAADVDGVRW